MKNTNALTSMKTSIHTIITTIIALSFTAAQAKETIVALSPDIADREIKNKVYTQVLTMALQDLAPGDQLIVLDGYHVKPIADFKIPAHAAYAKNPKARAEAMKASIQDFTAWMKKEDPESQALSDYSLRAPMLFQYCAKNTTVAKDNGAIILVGSLIYDDPAESAFSMKDGFYPSDAHLAVTRQESVYGLQEMKNTLENVPVYWVAAGSTFQDDGNRSSVERWWTLYCQTMGAVLASCDVSADPVLTSFRNRDTTAITSAQAEKEGKLEMRHAPIRIRVQVEEKTPPSAVPTAETNRTDINETPDAAFMTATQLSTDPIPTTEVENCRIGIRWPGKRDIDLYVLPFAGAEELYFRHQRSPQGIHVKDWLTSPEVENNGFETVEIRGKIDLSRMSIAANFYAGEKSPEGVNGVIRIQAHGRIYEAPFHINASTGNKGAQSAQRASSPHWTIIHPLKVLRKE
jgi:hypothetical protein